MKGTFNFGLDGQFSTYIGWIMPWDTPVTLLGESAEQVAEAQRELARIGIDRLEGAATGKPADWTDEELGHFERVTFADLSQVRHHREATVLDVRRASEYAQAHIDQAVNVPTHEIVNRMGDVPREAEVWVHCAGGYRASIVASFLAAAGIKVVAIDDDFGAAEPAGLPMTSGG